MSSFAELLQQGASQAWLYFPSAILLGALHGLEPGHSKTMMAAFIVAIRGSVKQAILLGLAATLSHTAVVWLVAMAGMYLGQGLDAETTEPYFQLASAAIIISIALWMLWRTWRGEQMWRFEEGDEHQHDHHHHDETHRIDTGHGRIELSIFEESVPPRWQLKALSGHAWPAGEVSLLTTRPDGLAQQFRFVDRGDYLESLDEIPEPHEFTARLSLGHAGHSHDYDLEFREHSHGHEHTELDGLELSLDGYQDAHERAHANDIRKRFSNRNVTTGQIIMFGLTGGLIPCPAAITVLLLCLQVKEVALGAVLVLCFSIGLAITLVTVGAAAAIGARQASNRWPWLGAVARRAPYFSSLLIIGVGIYVGVHGWIGLNASPMWELSGYFGLFLAAFGAATLLPMQSEAVLVGLLLTDRYAVWALLAVATTGNVLGSVLNWLLGRSIERYRHKRWFPVSEGKLEKAQQAYHRFGRWSLLLSWVPIIGDPLTVVAGVMREPFWSFLLIVFRIKLRQFALST